VNKLPRDELSKIQNTWELPANLRVNHHNAHENQSEAQKKVSVSMMSTAIESNHASLNHDI
jgi:hypothetical protein